MLIFTAPFSKQKLMKNRNLISDKNSSKRPENPGKPDEKRAGADFSRTFHEIDYYLLIRTYIVSGFRLTTYVIDQCTVDTGYRLHFASFRNFIALVYINLRKLTKEISCLLTPFSWF